MSNQETEPTKYTQAYFDKLFPPIHNPIIGHHPLDTVSHVHDVLCSIRQAIEAPPLDYETPEEVKRGLFYILTCLIEALRFEEDHRA